MIRKDFIAALKIIKSLTDDVEEVHLAMKKLDPDFGGFFISRIDTALLDMLKLVTNDKHNWISYYIYDLEWGTKWKKGTVTDKEGRDIPMKTMNDLYNVMIHKDL
ncbi:MAG: hypothetical protein KJI69_05150 [Patescibacteria group bacterium]|nr:hypothetical protein [Patescibacteria group bacterium]